MGALVGAATRQALRSANVSSCASNLRSLYVASRLYAQDFGAEPPHFTYRFRSGIDTSESLVSAYRSYGALTWECPLDGRRDELGRHKLSYEHAPGLLAIVQPDANGLIAWSLDSLKDSASFEFFRDVLEVETDEEGQPFSVTPHTGGWINVLFGDGHTKHQRPAVRIGGSSGPGVIGVAGTGSSQSPYLTLQP